MSSDEFDSRWRSCWCVERSCSCWFQHGWHRANGNWQNGKCTTCCDYYLFLALGSLLAQRSVWIVCYLFTNKLFQYSRFGFPFSAMTLLVGQQEGHLAWKNWMLVCWWWWFDWSFTRLIAPVVQLSPPPPSSFASINTG